MTVRIDPHLLQGQVQDWLDAEFPHFSLVAVLTHPALAVAGRELTDADRAESQRLAEEEWTIRIERRRQPVDNPVDNSVDNSRLFRSQGYPQPVDKWLPKAEGCSG